MLFNSKKIGVTAVLVTLGIAAVAVPAQARSSQRESPLPAGACVTEGAVGIPYRNGINCRVIEVDGHPRRFVVYVPRHRPVTGPLRPVVFMFHGSTGTGEQFLRVSGWRERADATGLVAVFPTGLRYQHNQTDHEFLASVQGPPGSEGFRLGSTSSTEFSNRPLPPTATRSIP